MNLPITIATQLQAQKLSKINSGGLKNPSSIKGFNRGMSHIRNTVVCHYCKSKISIDTAWAKTTKRSHKVYYCPEHYEKEGKNWEKRGSNPY